MKILKIFREPDLALTQLHIVKSSISETLEVNM
jgi:hypothetical protein